MATHALAEDARFTVAPLAGAILFDEALGDFAWARGPHPVWGAELNARFGRFHAGTRFWRTGTTQDAGFAGAALGANESSDVVLQSVQMTGGFTLFRRAATSFGLVASAGHLGMRYEPSFVEYAIEGTSETVRVDFAPIDEWIGGAGFSLQQGIGGKFSFRGEVESVFFSLDTDHRDGDEIVSERSRFQNWIARASLSYRLL
ncbi:MAG: hypothetical protein HKN20_04800 [Gemmatimonadetes bacterium]|nr:hypothetical protein [Gemmatimonadota bacterium]